MSIQAFNDEKQPKGKK